MNPNKFDKDLDTAATELAGNWLKYESFGWHDRPEDARKWAIIYTQTRDSGLADNSNHDAIVASLEDADPDGANWHEESHGHWACGHCDAIVVRTIVNGAVTPAFRELHRCAMALADYPLLDESDHSQRVYDAQFESVADTVRRKGDADGAEAVVELASRVFYHMWDNASRAFEDGSDQGYVDEDAVEYALRALGRHADSAAESAEESADDSAEVTS